MTRMGRRRILPTVYVLVALLAMAGLHLVLPVARLLAWPWSALGVVPLGIGVIMNVMADGALRRAGTTVRPFDESTALVTGGVYRISRHPMYLGIVLIVLGIAGLLGTLTPFLVIAPLALVLDRRFIRAEERMLEERFGEEWYEYKTSVRRWI